MNRRRLLEILCAGVAILALVLLAACGSSNKEEANTGSTPSGGTASDVPELKDGTLTVGSDISYAPIEFYQEGTQNAEGLDVDLGNALGEVLGVKVEFVNTGFDGIIPALNVNRFDIVMSALTVTEDRQKEIDFVPYLTAGTDILVAEGNPKNIHGIEDLSGLKVGVQLGTIQVDQLDAANQDLEAAGKPKIDVTTFDQNPLAVEQLRIGRFDAVIADSPVVANDARLSDGKLEACGLMIEAAPYGIGVRKDSTALKAALEDALKEIQDSGKYDEILAKWGLTPGALEQ
jgi:polar amino acid transport system substrate-binding protein